LSDLRATRLEKARALEAHGHPPYAFAYSPTHRAADLQRTHADLPKG
jgi:lysyl-tRNA synthetase class 2